MRSITNIADCGPTPIGDQEYEVKFDTGEEVFVEVCDGTVFGDVSDSERQEIKNYHYRD